MNEQDIIIKPGVIIPASELEFNFTRSGGPGGQHVNTSSTAVELRWDMANSTRISEVQRGLILERLPGYVDSKGVLHIVSTEHRSQHQNREAALARFGALLRRALHVARPRRPTAPSKGAKERRIQGKKQRGATKQMRRTPGMDEE
jgi:ribosome-associated protein